MSAADFQGFIEALGFAPPRHVEPGRFARFATNGKQGDTAGYAKLFPDLEGGIVGDFRSGEVWTWQAQKTKDYSDAERKAWRERVERERKEAEALREREEREAAQRARDVWNKAQPAPEDHPYLTAKGIKPHGTRLYRGPLAINGARCDGALVVPVRNSSGELQTLEFITPSGEKRFLPGGRKAGGYFSIGKPENVLCVAEGFATAATVHEASGHPVAVAFDAGNLAAVAKSLRQKFPAIRLIISADDDHATEGNPGRSKATEAAKAVSGLVAVPDFGDNRPQGATDFNDMAKALGLDAVRTAIEQAAELEKEAEDDSGLVLRRVSDVTPKPVKWLWPGRIARGKVSMLAGHPGLGKSQLCASLAAVVTTGGLWPVDRTRCEQGSVLIFSAEDDVEDTIRPRLEAAGADLSRVHVLETVTYKAADGSVIRRGFSLVDDLPRLAATLQRLGDVSLVVIDPVTAYMGDTDSHKNAEVRAVLSQVSEVAAKHGAAVVAVSHLRKSAAGEAMQQITGSLAFVAAARAAYIVAKDPADPARRLLLPAKNNLGDDQTGYAFGIETQTLPGGIPTSRVAWEAQRVTVTADEALAPIDLREDRSAVEDATEFLRGILADAPLSAKQVYREAGDAGHSQASIRRAQKLAGVESYKDGMGGGWLWRLAPKMLKSTEDAQAKTLSAFGVNERLREPEEPKSTTDADGERF
jgi:putative DNA primase/helicase